MRTSKYDLNCTPAQKVINYLIEQEHGGNEAAMSRYTGISRHTLDKYRFGKVERITNDLMVRLCPKYPKYSLNWLFSGEGDKLVKDGAKAPETAENWPILVKSLKEDNKALREQLSKALDTIAELTHILNCTKIARNAKNALADTSEAR